jgi:hypothetical protein
MFYDKDGNGKVFACQDDVLEGYVPYEESIHCSDPAPADAPADAPANPNKGLAKKHGFKKQELIAELTEAGIEFPADATADDLAAIYVAALEEADDDEE